MTTKAHRLLRRAGTAAAVALAMAVFAQPATARELLIDTLNYYPHGVGGDAQWNLTGSTYLSENVVIAVWADSGERLYLTDNYADGYRVSADLRWQTSNGVWHQRTLENPYGARKRTTLLNFDIAENRPVQIRACRPAIVDGCTRWRAGLHS